MSLIDFNSYSDVYIYLDPHMYVFFVHTVSGVFSIHTAKYGFQAIYGQALFAHFSVAIFGSYLARISNLFRLGTFFFWPDMVCLFLYIRPNCLVFGGSHPPMVSTFQPVLLGALLGRTPCTGRQAASKLAHQQAALGVHLGLDKALEIFQRGHRFLVAKRRKRRDSMTF